MLAALCEREILARDNAVLLALVADDARAIQREHQRLARRRMLGQPGAGTEAHQRQLHMVVVNQVRVDDLAVLIGQQVGKLQDFSRFQQIIHGCSLLQGQFGVYAIGTSAHADRRVDRGDERVARFEVPGTSGVVDNLELAATRPDDFATWVAFCADVRFGGKGEIRQQHAVMLPGNLRDGAAGDGRNVLVQRERTPGFGNHADTPSRCSSQRFKTRA